MSLSHKVPRKWLVPSTIDKECYQCQEDEYEFHCWLRKFITLTLILNDRCVSNFGYSIFVTFICIIVKVY